MIKVFEIDKEEFLDLLNKNKISIPLYSDVEAIDCYQDKELIKVCKNNEPVLLFLAPINNNGIRRKYRFFPYHSPIFLREETNLKKKEILKELFNYLFNKYDYTFLPLHPTFNVISSIHSEGGLTEMRHTHVTNKKITIDDVSSKMRNHIRNALKEVEVVIDNNYSNYDFNKAIKGKEEEVELRSKLAKQLLDNKKAITVKAIHNNEVIAGLVIAYDKEWAYLLHSYKDDSVRGTINLLILKAIEYAFDNLNIKYFDFEGSVIDDIDNFFTSFNVDIITYPYIIEAKDEEKLIGLINRSINIEGRINRVR